MSKKKEEVVVHFDFDSLSKDVPSTEQVLKTKLISENNTDAKEDTLGGVLKKARQSKKLSLAEVSSKLKIKEPFLKALETGDYYVFPSVSYAQAFLRTYINFLGLEAFPLLEKFHQETAYIKKETLELPEPQPVVSAPSRRIWIFSLLFIIVLYLLWYVIAAWRTEDKSALEQEGEADISQSTDDTTGDSLTVSSEEMPVLQTLPKEEAVKKMASILKGTAPNVGLIDKTGTEETKEGVTEKNRLTLKALEDVWIEVKDADEVLLSEILSAGEVYTPPYSDSLTLTTTNAGAVQASLNDKVLPAFGDVGAFVSRVPLDVESLKKDKH